MDKCSMDGDRGSSRAYAVGMYIVEKGMGSRILRN